MYLFLGFCVLFFFVVVIITDVKRGVAPKKSFSYGRKEYFLTKRESECYKRLVDLAGSNYFIFAQVHLSSLLDERQVKGQSWRGARAHVNRKSVDFLLCDKEYISPKLAIELDDWSHSRPDRIERDIEVERILKETGIPLLRIRSSNELEIRLQQALAPEVANTMGT